MYDIIALGELLIDFTPIGKSDRGNNIFEQNPGGAPANLLAYLSKLHAKTAFIGKVGNDSFGEFLKNTLKEKGIDTIGIKVDKDINTTLAFVHIDETGDRSFSFYRKPGADINLSIEELDNDLIKNTKIFHFGSLSLTDSPIRETTLKALEIAKNNGVFITYDPNLRTNLWNNLDDAKAMIIKGLEYASVVKVSEEELEFITNEKNIKMASAKLMREFNNIKMLCISLGAEGSIIKTDKYYEFVKAYKVQAIDTTGAGDTFFGGIIYKLLESNMRIEELSKEDIIDMLAFANAGAAIVTTKYGSISIMPSEEEISEFRRLF
ncbi:carbohydrate kinase family protein [Vallitalea maricola]|uniref:Carbohydrate kinase n=1 Tax=Vallitalea maricola TaxID=3074433 RepID=A0ACB5UG88_9FIRM|nr:carbohydrate kinase [Vallitalea sp. AN17-2]